MSDDSKEEMRRIVREGYERGNYAEEFREREELAVLEAEFMEAFAERVGPGETVVDLGCGVGVPYDRWLVDAGFEVTGVDMAPTHLREARRRVPKAEFVEADFSEWRPETTVDGALSLYAIFHVPADEHRALFDHIGRMLSPSAPLLVTLGLAGGETRADDWCGAPMAWSSLKPEAYRDLFDEIGFEIVEEATEGAPGADEHHWWVLAEYRPSRSNP